MGVGSRSRARRVVAVDGVDWERGVREGSRIDFGNFRQGLNAGGRLSLLEVVVVDVALAAGAADAGRDAGVAEVVALTASAESLRVVVVGRLVLRVVVVGCKLALIGTLDELVALVGVLDELVPLLGTLDELVALVGALAVLMAIVGAVLVVVVPVASPLLEGVFPLGTVQLVHVFQVLLFQLSYLSLSLPSWPLLVSLSVPPPTGI